MKPDDVSQRLSRISTQWSMVVQAHLDDTEQVQPSRAELVQRYSGAVYRYLLAVVRDPDVAEELCQEFILKFLQGGFHRASPERGRFRDYIKSSVINLARDHGRKQLHALKPLPDQIAEPNAGIQGSQDSDDSFALAWREEVMDRTWNSLLQQRPAYHALLRVRVDCPQLSSREIADRYVAEQSKPMTSANVRKTLQRAHIKFADLLVEEVATSLEQPDVRLLNLELSELDLLKYCRSAVRRWETKNK